MKNSLDAALKRFARTLLRIEQSDLPSFKKTFFDEIDRIAELIEISPEPERNREEFFRLCGVVDQSLLHGRTRQKPLGYSGDFLLLDWIYTQKTSESGIGKLYDELFHTYEASRAVRNRKEYFNRLCNTLAEEKRADIEVLNLGCGSCREVVEAVSSRANGYVYRFHCVDHESLAIEYARKILSGSEAEPYVDLECSNIFRFRPKKTYDLIWSAGLFDYLDDRAASLLVKRCWPHLRPGGWFIFGNFSRLNPTRRGMELVGKWYLLHRSADDLIGIVEKAGIPYGKLEVDTEPLGINLFCKIQK